MEIGIWHFTFNPTRHQMAKLGIDVSKVTSPFSPLPAGNYTLKVAHAEAKPSKKGNPMVELQYEVIGHPQFSGRKLFNYAVLTQDSGQFLVHQHALAADDDPHDPDPERWLNSQFDAEVSIEEGEQGPQNRVTPLIDVKDLIRKRNAGGVVVNI
jgi:hypothetical protein